MPASTPKPDEFGRYRVLDKDTGAKRSVVASQLPHGNHEVLDEPASDLGGDALPVEYPDVEPAAPTGYSAQKKDDLVQEIAARNEGRAEDDLIVPAEPGNKPDLIAALEADDLEKENADG